MMPSNLPPGLSNADIEAQMENPYVQEALAAINAFFWGGWYEKHKEQLIAILERLADDSCNLGAEERGC